MASANKSTGLQIALVFVSMIAIIAAVVGFLQFRTAGDLEARLKLANDKFTKADGDLHKASTNLNDLKKYVGYAPESPEVGTAEAAEGETTVIGQAKKKLADVAKQVGQDDAPQANIAAAIDRLAAKIASLQEELTARNAELNKHKEKITALESQYRKEVDAHETARRNAEKERAEAVNSKEQIATDKAKEVAEQEKKNQELQAKLQSSEATRTQEGEANKGVIGRLRDTNKSLLTKWEGEHKENFEVPSGLIDLVDRDTSLVWINRGSADALHKGITFSVYNQVNKGVARAKSEIKGAIEVTRIVGPHQAEARITRSKEMEPMIKGDPIYTPLWKMGQKERFAVVGLIDLDNDGVAQERDVLHQLVESAGGLIVDEVDDKGIRHPEHGNINVGMKFLVVGKIPDYSESLEQDRDAHKKIGELHKTMRDEALEHGVRIVSLEDFLAYVGYEPGRRIYRPGVTPGWNLHQGTNSEKLPQSLGAVSGYDAYGTKTEIRQSTGQTSGKVSTKEGWRR